MVQVGSGPDQSHLAVMPLVESCPQGNVILHFPVDQQLLGQAHKKSILWSGMYLNSSEAIEFGMNLIDAAEASIEQEHDS